MALVMPNPPQYGGAEAFGEKIRRLEQLIGPIPNIEKFDHTYQQSRAYDDLTELLLQRLPRVFPQQLKGLLIDGYKSVLLNKILPIRELLPHEGLRIEWSTFKFDHGLAPQLAVEGVAPIYTHHKDKHSTRAVRRAAGIREEAGFWMTPEGTAMWKNKILQLATIIQRTNEYDCMVTLLRTPFQQRSKGNSVNGPYNVYGRADDLVRFSDRLEMEVRYFGLVNKATDSRGLMKFITTVRTSMAQRGVQPDTMIVPPLMVPFYFGNNDDLWHYSSAGPEAMRNRENFTDINANGPVRSQSFQGLELLDMHISRPTNDENVSEANDLLTVPKQIGEFYASEIQGVALELKDFGSYRGSFRDIKIMNEKHGNVAPLRFTDMIDNCMRWSPDDNNSLDIDAHQGLTNDIFIGHDGQLVNAWVDVREDYLPANMLERVSRTLAQLVGSQENAEKLTGMIERLSEMNNNVNPPPLRDDAGVLHRHNANDPQQLARYNELRTQLRGRYSQILLRAINKLTSTIKGMQPNYIANQGFPVDTDSLLLLIQRITESQWGAVFNRPGNNDHIRTLGVHLSNMSWLHRIMTTIWLKTPINRKTLLDQHDKDILVPINFLVTRPYMTFNVSSAIIMKAGNETGETAIGGVDFQATTNAMDRMLYASIVYYGKSYVTNPDNVTVAPSIFIQSYIKGYDHTFITRRDIEDEIHQQHGLFESRNSILCMALPATERVSLHSVIDIRGRHEQLKNEIDRNENAPFYSTSEFYRNLLRLDGTHLRNPANPFVDYETMDLRGNSICHRGHYEYGPNFCYVSPGLGHLGGNCYDGVNETRVPGIYATTRQITYNGKICQPM